MIHSESLTSIAPAFAKAQSELQHASKDSSNPHFKSKYADLAEVVDTIKPVFAANGLFYTQGFTPHDTGVVIDTRIWHTSGEWIGDGGLHLPLDKQNAQGVGSAVTYGRRYALLALSGVAPDDDDDGNAASTPSKRPQSSSKPSPAKNAATTPVLVSKEQAAELTAAAIAKGIDPALAERQAINTHAERFLEALTNLKEKK